MIIHIPVDDFCSLSMARRKNELGSMLTWPLANFGKTLRVQQLNILALNLIDLLMQLIGISALNQRSVVY